MPHALLSCSVSGDRYPFQRDPLMMYDYLGAFRPLLFMTVLLSVLTISEKARDLLREIKNIDV